MVLFTHLKIILLQYFHFSIFNFSKISSSQTDWRWTIRLETILCINSLFDNISDKWAIRFFFFSLLSRPYVLMQALSNETNVKISNP